MRDFILLIIVIAYMIGGYFFVDKADKFFNENFKGFDYDDDEIENTSTLQDEENENESLNKPQK